MFFDRVTGEAINELCDTLEQAEDIKEEIESEVTSKHTQHLSLIHI